MRISFLFAMGLLAACACSKNTNQPASHQVTMQDYSFNPESLNISVGDTVTWVNDGATSHTTTSGTVGAPDGNWDSGTMAPGARYQHVFPAAGNFRYYCSFHATTNGMVGVIAVH